MSLKVNDQLALDYLHLLRKKQPCCLGTNFSRNPKKGKLIKMKNDLFLENWFFCLFILRFTFSETKFVGIWFIVFRVATVRVYCCFPWTVFARVPTLFGRFSLLCLWLSINIFSRLESLKKGNCKLWTISRLNIGLFSHFRTLDINDCSLILSFRWNFCKMRAIG